MKVNVLPAIFLSTLVSGCVSPSSWYRLPDAQGENWAYHVCRLELPAGRDVKWSEIGRICNIGVAGFSVARVFVELREGASTREAFVTKPLFDKTSEIEIIAYHHVEGRLETTSYTSVNIPPPSSPRASLWGWFDIPVIGPGLNVAIYGRNIPACSPVPSVSMVMTIYVTTGMRCESKTKFEYGDP